jgi:hypothetical protein
LAQEADFGLLQLSEIRCLQPSASQQHTFGQAPNCSLRQLLKYLGLLLASHPGTIAV